MVTTDDPKSPSVTLVISGFVEKFATITPQYVRLSGEVGREIRVPVSIIPEKKYDFNILEVNASKGKDIRYDLTEKEFPQGDGYQLMIESIKKEKGRYNDTITLKTDSTIRPFIKIRVYGRLSAPKVAPAGSDGSNPKSD